MGGNIVRRLMQHGHSTRRLRQGCRKRLPRSPPRARQAPPRWRILSRSWSRRAPPGSCCRRARSPRRRSTPLAKLMETGDVIIDGGNTFWQDDVRRGKALRERGIALSRRRHQRRRLGPRARLLHDDRRRQGGGRPARSDLQDAGARASATSRAPPAARGAIRASSRATFMPARSAPGISSRWSTTASNTA